MSLIHPPLTAFPFALLTVVLLGELANLYFRSTKLDFVNRINLVFAALGASLAFASGYWEVDGVVERFSVDRDAVAEHYNLARLFLFSLVPTVALKFVVAVATEKKRLLIGAYWVALVVSFALAICTGREGGELVFVHGAGVERGQVNRD